MVSNELKVSSPQDPPIPLRGDIEHPGLFPGMRWAWQFFSGMLTSFKGGNYYA